MKTVIEFDIEKATQALNYLAKREGGKIDKMKAIKLVWLADRFHLRKYGRPISNDNYLAMEYGPVGSAIKDVADNSDFLSSEEIKYSAGYLKPDEQKHFIESINEVDADVFSETDLEALDLVYTKYGKKHALWLAKMSHYFPEWKKFEQEILTNSISRGNMSYVDFFKNPEKDIPNENIFNEKKEELEESEKIFNENFLVASFWK
ncbi:MAG: Panacea domain-containing protein [Candidatus Azambacteria bacterium]|nr:Panacea domain-containing protein [Candidatus Azambacteria bacterium]